MIDRIADASIGAVVLIRLLSFTECITKRGGGVLVLILYLIKLLIDGYLIILLSWDGTILASICRKFWLNQQIATL